jgi:hypothetical protein
LNTIVLLKLLKDGSCSSCFSFFDIYKRAALGEIMSMAFIPLVIASLYKIVNQKSDKYYFLSISMALVLISHNISFFLCLVYLGIYLLINFKEINKKVIINILKAGILAIGLTSFFIFPMLEFFESGDYYVNHINNFTEIGSMALNPLSLINFFSYLSISNLNLGLIISIGTVAQLANLKYRKFAILAIVFSIFTTSIIPFHYFDFMVFIQFPFRFYLLATPIACIISSQFYTRFYKKIWISIICIVLIFCSILSYNILKNKDFLEINFKYSDLLSGEYGEPVNELWGYNNYELFGAEYLPYSILINYNEFGTFARYTNLDKVDAKLEKYFTTLKITINKGYKDLDVLLPISYYKGYHLYLCDKNFSPLKEVKIHKDEYYPLITFNLENNIKSNYILKYEATLIQNTSLVISISSFILLIFIIFKNKTR